MHTIYPATTFTSNITYPSATYPNPTYTTGTQTEIDNGWAFFTSNILLHLPDWSNGSGRPGLLACHGRSNTAVSAFGSDFGSRWGDYIPSLVNAGYVVLAMDLGADAWSNNMALRVIDQAYTYLIGITGGTLVGVLGSSMGSITALQWVRRNTDKVRGTFLIGAFTDIDTSRGTGGWVTPYSIGGGDPNAGITYAAPGAALASLNGAYKCTTDAQWTANAIIQRHPPARYPELWRGQKIIVAHALMDETIPYQASDWWVKQVADPGVVFRPVPISSGLHEPKSLLSGNDTATLAAGGLPRYELRDFFNGLL